MSIVGLREQPRETILRTFRLDKDIVGGIEKVAHEKHTSPNNLVNLLLRDYLQWGFYYETRGSVSVSKRTFQSILDHLSEQEIYALGQKLYTNAKEMALLKTGKWDLEAYLALADSAKYSGGARTEIKRDGDQYVIIMHHDLGPKYSQLVKSYHSTILSEFADGLKTDTSDSTVVFSFRPLNHSS